MFVFAKMMIKHHIKRSYMIILGIACSVTMMFCMIQMGDSINNKYKEQALGTNLHDFSISGLTKEQAEFIKGELDKEKIEASGISWSDYREMQMKPEAFQKIELQICAGTREGLEETGLRLRNGRWSESSDEIVLEQYVCEMLGSRIGDEVAVVCGLTGEIYCFRLVGIMENAPTLFSGDRPEGVMNVSFSFLYEAGLTTPGAEEYNLIVTVTSDVDAYDDEEVAELEYKAQELLARIYGLDSFNDTSRRLVSGQASEEEGEIVRRINRNTVFNNSKWENFVEYGYQSENVNLLKALPILLAVSMILLIFNSMHLAIAENTRELGMLRCIGMNYRQTGLIVFFENLFYCILGYGIGIVFGNIMNQFFAKNILLYMTGEHVGVRQLPSSYLLTAAVVLIALVLAFALSIHKIIALTPIEASKYNGLAVKNQKVQTMEQWSCVKFSKRNIKRERSKSMIVMLSMIFSMMILMVIVNFMLNVKLPEKDPKSGFSDYEVYIPRDGWVDAIEGISGVELSIPEIEKVRGVTGVEKIYAIGTALDLESYMYQQNGNSISAIIYDDALFQWLLEQNGKTELWQKELDAVCVVTGTDEEEQELLEEIQETGAIAYRLKGGKEGTLHVGSVLHTDYIPENKGTGSGRGSVTIILTEKAALEIYGAYSYTDVMVKLNSHAKEGTYSEIAAVFADNEYAICMSYEMGMEKIITDALVLIYIAAMIVFATAVTAILNMMIIMKANLILRRKEYGIWRALGMALKRLKRTISIEVLLMLSTSYVIAVVLSFPLLCYLCSALIENFNVTGTVAGYLGVGVGFILPVYILVMSGLKFKRTNEIIADIREE
ncbi:MAG: ABC transporter permease [Lachnospiraceae bacterium]|nr:ABC transporter permease [Lachnospiraceae bacterium]